MTHVNQIPLRWFLWLRVSLVVLLCSATFIALFLSLRSELPVPMAVLPVHAVAHSSDKPHETDAIENELGRSEPALGGQVHFSSSLFENEVLVRFDMPAALGFSHLVIHATHLIDSRCKAISSPHLEFQILQQVGAHQLTNLNTSSHSGPWLCRLKFLGPGDVSLELHYAERFDAWVESFNQKNFFVQGAMLALALMSLLLSLLMASRMLLALFLWIILTLHFLAIAAGWDHALYIYGLLKVSAATWRELNFLAYFGLLFVLLQLSEHKAIHAASRLVGAFALMVGLLSVAPINHGLFLVCYWSFLAAACSILLWCLKINFRNGSAENSHYLSLALFSCLVGGVLQIMSMWVSLEYTLHVIGGRAVAIGAAVMLILAVSDALNKNRKQKVALLNRLELANGELEGVFQLMPQAVFKLDQEGRLVKTNRVFDAINSECLQDFQKPVLAADALELMQDNQDELVLHSKSGASRHFRVRLADIPEGKIGVLHDISAEKTKELAQFYQIIHDEESGAMNRMGLEHLLAARCTDGARAGHVVRILLLQEPTGLSALSTQGISRTMLRAFSVQLKDACKFLGELVHMGSGTFCVLINSSKEEQALTMLAEPRLWAQIKLQSLGSDAFRVRIDGLKLDLSHGAVDALQQVEAFAAPSPLGEFELGDHRSSSSVNLTPAASAL